MSFLMATMMACHQAKKGEVVLNHQQIEAATPGLREAYAAFNRGDINAAVRILDPGVEWIEPPEFPGGGTYHGVEGAKRYLVQSRASAAQVISEPEQFLNTGDRIIVFVHARVLPKGSDTLQDVRPADVYTFQAAEQRTCERLQIETMPAVGGRHSSSKIRISASPN